MGILSTNLLNLLKPNSKSISSPNLGYIRRIASQPAVTGFDAAIPPPSKQHNNKLMLLIQRFVKKSVNYSLISTAQEKSSWKDHHIKLSHPCSLAFARHGSYILAGACKNLMLVFLYDLDPSSPQEVLWDSTTNQLIKFLPEFNPPREHFEGRVTYTDICNYGFGFDPESQDYKVLRYLQFDYDDGSDSYDHAYIDLYSLKTDTWKEITSDSKSYSGARPSREPTIHINGVYYWEALFSPVDPGVVILSFDFAKEKFSHIPLPLEIEAGSFDPVILAKIKKERERKLLVEYVLADLDGSLGAVVHSKLVRAADLDWSLGAFVHSNLVHPAEGEGDGEEEKQKQPFAFEILVWNGEMWAPRVPKITIEVLGGVAKVLGLFENDKLLLQSGGSKGELLLFDCAASELDNLGVHADPGRFDIFPYVGNSAAFHSMDGK